MGILINSINKVNDQYKKEYSRYGSTYEPGDLNCLPTDKEIAERLKKYFPDHLPKIPLPKNWCITHNRSEEKGCPDCRREDDVQKRIEENEKYRITIFPPTPPNLPPQK